MVRPKVVAVALAVWRKVSGESEWQYATVISSPKKPQSQPQHQKINKQARMSQGKCGKIARSPGYMGLKVWK